ncbi:hypothetical protein D5086_005572 [Populus alba]|uniref:Uncharacterized protein n=1 Tax=Populus alba TaxID=43335 RepID=A0ACC4CUR7_POPAL
MELTMLTSGGFGGEASFDLSVNPYIRFALEFNKIGLALRCFQGFLHVAEYPPDANQGPDIPSAATSFPSFDATMFFPSDDCGESHPCCLSFSCSCCKNCSPSELSDSSPLMNSKSVLKTLVSGCIRRCLAIVSSRPPMCNRCKKKHASIAPSAIVKNHSEQPESDHLFSSVSNCHSCN